MLGLAFGTHAAAHAMAPPSRNGLPLLDLEQFDPGSDYVQVSVDVVTPTGPSALCTDDTLHEYFDFSITSVMTLCDLATSNCDHFSYDANATEPSSARTTETLSICETLNPPNVIGSVSSSCSARSTALQRRSVRSVHVTTTHSAPLDIAMPTQLPRVGKHTTTPEAWHQQLERGLEVRRRQTLEVKARDWKWAGHAQRLGRMRVRGEDPEGRVEEERYFRPEGG